MSIQYSPATAQDNSAIIELWNAAFGPHWPLTEQLRRQTVDHDPYYEPEGAIAARDGEKLVGYVLSKSMKNAGPELGRFERRGGIGALCVHPDYQRQGVGSELLARAENFLQENGSPLTLLYYPHHILPGIPVENDGARLFFENHGYGNWRECVDLKRDLRDFELPEKVQRAMETNPTVELRPARADEAEAIIAFVSREFAGGWTYSTKSHFERGGNPSDLIIAVEDGEVIGFCHTADFNSNWLLPSTYWFPLLGEKFGGLGPVGLAAEHRKRGLGLALTAAGVADLQRRGVQQMAIDWTNLIAFYEQLGFEVWKRYLQGEKL